VVIRSAGYATLARLRAASEADAGKSISRARDQYVVFKDRFERWLRANPTTPQRLAQIEREKKNITAGVDQSIAFALAMYRLTPAAPRPAQRQQQTPAPDSRMKIGPAFDLLDPHARR
jgi:hypothetical protein